MTRDSGRLKGNSPIRTMDRLGSKHRIDRDLPKKEAEGLNLLISSKIHVTIRWFASEM